MERCAPLPAMEQSLTQGPKCDLCRDNEATWVSTLGPKTSTRFQIEEARSNLDPQDFSFCLPPDHVTDGLVCPVGMKNAESDARRTQDAKRESVQRTMMLSREPLRILTGGDPECSGHPVFPVSLRGLLGPKHQLHRQAPSAEWRPKRLCHRR